LRAKIERSPTIRSLSWFSRCLSLPHFRQDEMQRSWKKASFSFESIDFSCCSKGTKSLYHFWPHIFG